MMIALEKPSLMSFAGARNQQISNISNSGFQIARRMPIALIKAYPHLHNTIILSYNMIVC